MGKDIELTVEQAKFLAFLKNEMGLAGQKRQILQETALKLIQFYAVELKVPKGWIFKEKLNAFVSSTKSKEG